MGKPNVPEDLDLRIGTPREAWLEKIRKALSDEKDNCEWTARLNERFLTVLEEEIAAEKL